MSCRDFYTFVENNINMEANKSDFRLEGYLIRKSEFKIDTNFDKEDTLNINIHPNGLKEKDKFTLTLDLHIKDKKDLFNVNILMEAYFYFREDIPFDMMGHFFTINAPAIIFPYIRGYISMLTSLSGCGTVMLPTLNLTDLGKELASNIKEIQ